MEGYGPRPAAVINVRLSVTGTAGEMRCARLRHDVLPCLVDLFALKRERGVDD